MAGFTLDSINPAFLNVEHAVRGELAIKAQEYRVRLAAGASDLPFTKVIFSNAGNPQEKGLDQKPLTFLRQVAALTEYPELIHSAPNVFPSDVIDRAQELLAEVGSIGAYTHSQGVPLIRKHVAEFIAERDGHPASADDIFLTAGASTGVELLIDMLVNSPQAGILIPIPQYPLYTGTLARRQGVPVPYYLDEARGWSTTPADVTNAIKKARSEGTDVRALVVINPGNPTGALLDAETMTALVKLCEEHALVLLADEVYQVNLHEAATHPFTSFKKVVRDLDSRVPLISLHSISKGVTGECGRRGGYFELTNFAPDVRAVLYKMVPNAPVAGQIGVDCMVRPPLPGSASHALWKEETDAIHVALADRTHAMANRLNALQGVSCVRSPGALYLYPRIYLTQRAIAAADKAGNAPDMFYALRLLDETGICVTPGSGFGQKGGEQHYRLTCLCSGVEEYVGALERFHNAFMENYKD